MNTNGVNMEAANFEQRKGRAVPKSKYFQEHPTLAIQAESCQCLPLKATLALECKECPRSVQTQNFEVTTESSSYIVTYSVRINYNESRELGLKLMTC